MRTMAFKIHEKTLKTLIKCLKEDKVFVTRDELLKFLKKNKELASDLVGNDCLDDGIIDTISTSIATGRKQSERE